MFDKEHLSDYLRQVFPDVVPVLESGTLVRYDYFPNGFVGFSHRAEQDQFTGNRFAVNQEGYYLVEGEQFQKLWESFTDEPVRGQFVEFDEMADLVEDFADAILGENYNISESQNIKQTSELGLSDEWREVFEDSFTNLFEVSYQNVRTVNGIKRQPRGKVFHSAKAKRGYMQAARKRARAPKMSSAVRNRISRGVSKAHRKGLFDDSTKVRRVGKFGLQQNRNLNNSIQTSPPKNPFIQEVSEGYSVKKEELGDASTLSDSIEAYLLKNCLKGKWEGLRSFSKEQKDGAYLLNFEGELSDNKVGVHFLIYKPYEKTGQIDHVIVWLTESLISADFISKNKGQREKTSGTVTFNWEFSGSSTFIRNLNNLAEELNSVSSDSTLKESEIYTMESFDSVNEYSKNNLDFSDPKVSSGFVQASLKIIGKSYNIIPDLSSKWAGQTDLKLDFGKGNGIWVEQSTSEEDDYETRVIVTEPLATKQFVSKWKLKGYKATGQEEGDYTAGYKVTLDSSDTDELREFFDDLQKSVTSSKMNENTEFIKEDSREDPPEDNPDYGPETRKEFKKVADIVKKAGGYMSSYGVDEGYHASVFLPIFDWEYCPKTVKNAFDKLWDYTESKPPKIEVESDDNEDGTLFLITW